MSFIQLEFYIVPEDHVHQINHVSLMFQQICISIVLLNVHIEMFEKI